MANTSQLIERQNQQGFALLEAMLALFILTIGILGVAGLQITAMQSGSLATQRLFVVMKTQELIERITANPGLNTITLQQNAASNAAIISSVVNFSVDQTYAVAGYGQNNGCSNPVGTVLVATCTPLQMAQHDINEWRTELARFLPATPAPVYTVTVDNAVTRNVSLTVTWSDRGAQHSYAVTTQIQPLVN